MHPPALPQVDFRDPSRAEPSRADKLCRALDNLETLGPSLIPETRVLSMLSVCACSP